MSQVITNVQLLLLRPSQEAWEYRFVADPGNTVRRQETDDVHFLSSHFALVSGHLACLWIAPPIRGYGYRVSRSDWHSEPGLRNIRVFF